MRFGVMQVRQLFLADRKDDSGKFLIPIGQKVKLVLDVPMNRGLNRGGADPDRLPPHERRDETEQCATPAPQRYDAAWP
jgi:hypothetical protein